MKKFLSILFAGVLVMTTTPAFAQISSTLGSQQIPASGTLSGSSSLSVTLVGATDTTQLQFDSDLGNGEVAVGDAGVVAPQEIQVDFSSNELGFKAVIISTDNRTLTSGVQYTGTGTGSGLVGGSDSALSTPLHWTVFQTQTDAENYVWAADGTGAIQNTNQLFVADRRQDESSDIPTPAPFDTPAVLGFATVIGGISGLDAFLPDIPVDDGGGNNRLVANGQAFLKVAADYQGQQAQAYSTETLTLDLVVLS